MKTLAASALVVAIMPSVASAHPGHGQTDPQSWAHYLTEPVHVAILAAASGAAVLWSMLLRRKRRES